ncbi:hypothetical protein [Culicoidibacter larvae]|uniref:Polymer-forming cytoskeletal protein n=1 Tax=Culicoidibacter larvae TaxID=2579976 RepID=A0A5R8QIC1_9FIRM|nr:hypothetical protein [Culicoidibacter larvae]TLG77466.1 hypothetical protein FEZ08_02260 [Culicoidibacter larvae]
MNNLNFEGIGSAQGGEYDRVSIEGLCTCKGDIKARSISIEGIFHGKGMIEAGDFDCTGVAEMSGDIRARKMNVSGVVSVKGTKVEAEDIECDGTINIDGEISADRIYANGFVNASEIVGDEVTINSEFGGFSRIIIRKFSKIELIEATKVNVSNVKAKKVSGADLIIGPKCKIDVVDCSGTLRVDPSAEIGEIIGEYEMR